MFHFLLLLELFELKLVSKAFNELVNYDINFKRIFELTNSMCNEVFWSEKIQKNLSDLKEIIDSEFKDDPMLQLYIKYKVSSIFNKVSLYPIFCHFAFCKRSCVSDTVFCRIYSRVFPNCLIDEYGLFDEILIDDCFSDKFKAFFLPKYYMYLCIRAINTLTKINQNFLVICIMNLKRVVARFL